MADEYRREYERWLSSDALSEDERVELEAVRGDDEAVRDRFSAPLVFGTAGLRGVMGAGINRMNAHVVRQTTRALAALVLRGGDAAAERGVAVCYDCRVNSRLFAEEAARVLADAGVRVRLFGDMRPTPELSFAIREYGCEAGINITASHNPKEYNGYKVYWGDGAQMPPSHAAVVAKEKDSLDVLGCAPRVSFGEAKAKGLIMELGEETDEAYLAKVLACAVSPQARQAAASLRLVYTPFHGTGRLLVPEALRRMGFGSVSCVEEQMTPDGLFPTVASPNPENKEGFALAVEKARAEGANLIIGTDPDADRMGLMLRNNEGEYVTLSGNQVGVLLLDYLIRAKRQNGTMPRNPACVKTIVTTEMARAVAEKNGVACFDTFTGFKFMAELIKEFEAEDSHSYIFAFEESYGYLCGDHARDKDAVVASVLAAEMAAWYSMRGMTLYEAMEALYAEYGYYAENTVNLVMPGLSGMEKMARTMARLRGDAPGDIAGTPVLAARDYLAGLRVPRNGGREALSPRGSDVLAYELADGTVFIVRPSGTEPKIKVYVLTKGGSRAEAGEKARMYSDYAKTLAND
ncbi:MAG: phospho-sugar mutase [Oscillospiraceae bacterium]|jgi:phosphoglucomutase|nr:phospho-sugar mutase [Oscillospiraceae bacterium]